MKYTGVLCREFLSAHLPPSTPVVMAGAGGGGCDALLGGLSYEEELDQKPSPQLAAQHPETTAKDSTATTSATSDSSNSSNNGGNDGVAAVAGARADTSRTPAARLEPASSTCDCRAAAGAARGEMPPPSSTTATAAATTTITATPRARQLSPGDAPGVSAAAADGSNGELEVEGEVAGGEEPEDGGIDMEVCTVGDLYPWRNMYGATGRRDLLRVGFLRQQVMDDPEGFSAPSLSLFFFFFSSPRDLYARVYQTHVCA